MDKCSASDQVQTVGFPTSVLPLVLHAHSSFMCWADRCDRETCALPGCYSAWLVAICLHQSLNNCVLRCYRHSAWTAWPFDMGQIICPKHRQITTYLLCVTCQKSDDLIYSAAEAGNNDAFVIMDVVRQYRKSLYHFLTFCAFNTSSRLISVNRRLISMGGTCFTHKNGITFEIRRTNFQFGCHCRWLTPAPSGAFYRYYKCCLYKRKTKDKQYT